MKIRQNQIEGKQPLSNLTPTQISSVPADQESEIDQLASQIKRIIFGNGTGNWNDDFISQIGDCSLRDLFLSGGGTGNNDPHSVQNKNMVARNTVADGDLACDIAIQGRPALDGYVRVLINGVGVSLGDGVKTEDCYFSNNNGVSARLIRDIDSGDTLHWNGSVAGYQLKSNFRIDFDFES